MKKSEFIIALLLTLAIALSNFYSLYRDNKIKDAILKLDENGTFMQKEIQDIQDNYVSFEALQPVLTDFEDYQLEVDEMRNNLNDFNSLWKQLFGYEQKQYNLRGR